MRLLTFLFRSLVQKDSAATETLALQVSVDATFLREGQAVEAEQVKRDDSAQSVLNDAVQIKVRNQGPCSCFTCPAIQVTYAVPEKWCLCHNCDVAWGCGSRQRKGAPSLHFQAQIVAIQTSCLSSCRIPICVIRALHLVACSITDSINVTAQKLFPLLTKRLTLTSFGACRF